MVIMKQTQKWRRIEDEHVVVATIESVEVDTRWSNPIVIATIGIANTGIAIAQAFGETFFKLMEEVKQHKDNISNLEN